MMSLAFPKTILLLSAVWALYTLWMVPYQNGLLTSLLDLSKPGAYLPGTESVPMRQIYTGIKPVDNQIGIMVGFFWPALDGNRADVSLVFLEIVSQAMASWILVTIESLRLGNRGKWYITSVTMAGLLMQNLGFGLVVPLWTCLHLAFSSTVQSPTSTSLISSNPLPLLTLPLSAILAFCLPNMLMSLTPPHPFCADYATKQLYTALAQCWPLTLTGFQLLLPIAISASTPGINALSEDDKKVQCLTYLRRCYVFALVSATCAHLIAVGIPLLAHRFPALFSPAYLPQLQLAHIFLAQSPLLPVQRVVASTADSVLRFVQWDLLIGSSAVLVWAVTLRVQSQARGGVGGYEWLEGLVKVAVLVGVSGPVGAAVAVVWERDELVFGREREREREREWERKGR